MLEICTVVLFFIGFYGLIVSRNVIKSIASISIMEVAVILFFLSVGYREGVGPPIGHDLADVADPLPQSLMFTAIIIGVAVTAVNITMLISLTRQTKSTDWDRIKG